MKPFLKCILEIVTLLHLIEWNQVYRQIHRYGARLNLDPLESGVKRTSTTEFRPMDPLPFMVITSYPS